MVKDIERYINEKEYNNSSVEVVLHALCNCLGISIILYQTDGEIVNITANAPGRDNGVLFTGDIHLGKTGLNSSAHYFSTLPEPIRQQVQLVQTLVLKQISSQSW